MVFLLADDIFVFVERCFRRANDRRDQRYVIGTGHPPEIHRIAVEPGARRAVAHIFRAGKHSLHRHRMMRRNEGVLDLDAVRAAGAHAKRLIAAPIVQDAQLVARHRHAENLRRPISNRQPGATNEMGGVRYARAEIPQTAEPVAAFDRREHAAWRHPMRRGKMTVGAKQFALRLLGPMRRNQKRMRRAERKAPAGRRMAMRDFQHGAVKSRDDRTHSRRTCAAAPPDRGRLSGTPDVAPASNSRVRHSPPAAGAAAA